MDPMDVLGSLLGRKSSTGDSGASGGSILRDILGRRNSPVSSQPKVHPQARQPRTIGEAAEALEELLNVGGRGDHSGQSRSASTSLPVETGTSATKRSPLPPVHSGQVSKSKPIDEQTRLLIQAMISAAKSDGQITQEEQEKMVARIESREEADFLRREFERPVDVRSLCWSVPRGMEENVYTMSLLAIDLDEQKEANYLADLAQGLRMDPNQCNEIHRKYGAPMIFKSS